jgi:hypothetical protein
MMLGRTEGQHRRVPRRVQYQALSVIGKTYSANLCDRLCELTVHDG